MDIAAIAQTSPYFNDIKSAPKPACVLTPDLLFPDAAKQWLASRSVKATSALHKGRYIRDNTKESYKQYVRSLELYFSSLKLGDIHLGHLEAYQSARLQGVEPFIRFRRPQDAKARMIDGVLVPAVGKTLCPVKAKRR